MIKQHIKIDKDFNIIEYKETNDAGKVIYKEVRTYNPDNSLKEVKIKEGRKTTREKYKDDTLVHTTYPNGNTMIYLGNGRTIYWEKPENI